MTIQEWRRARLRHLAESVRFLSDEYDAMPPVAVELAEEVERYLAAEEEPSEPNPAVGSNVLYGMFGPR